jgi:hypothetical protein
MQDAKFLQVHPLRTSGLYASQCPIEHKVIIVKIQNKEPKMAFINYVAEDKIPPGDRVPDQDNILRIHGIHSRTMRQHYDLYRQLMYSKGPLSRIQREMIAVVVSAQNECRY